MDSFAVVEQFERELAEFCGSRFAVAVMTGTAAIFLSLLYWREHVGKQTIICPARTFISVPMAIRQAGHELEFSDYPWNGVYELFPTSIWDSALRFHRRMYTRGLHCLSFHARKHLAIGEGGAVLTDDEDAAKWLKAARYSGRRGPDYRIEHVDMFGYQLYMSPEKAARGLHLLSYIAGDLPDQVVEYPDLRECPVFKEAA